MRWHLLIGVNLILDLLRRTAICVQRQRARIDQKTAKEVRTGREKQARHDLQNKRQSMELRDIPLDIA